MSAPFLAATHVASLGEGRYRSRFEVPWYQGRGAYGGVVSGQILRAMEHAVADPSRPLRSFTVHFCAPATEGEAEVRVRVERAGKIVSHVTARTENTAGVVAVATATFGTARPTTPRYLDAKRPVAPLPSEVDVVPEDVPMPTFCQFFEYRFCVGSVPYSASEPRLGGWIRPKGEPLPLDAALCVGLLDAYPPSILGSLSEPRPVASVDFTVHFFQSLPRPEDRPGAHYLRTGVSRWAGEGYAEDLQELWTEEGELIAQCRQCIAVLG